METVEDKAQNVLHEVELLVEEAVLCQLIVHLLAELLDALGVSVS